MKADSAVVDPLRSSVPARIFPGLFGGFLGLTLLKFGNPPIMEKWVSAPQNIYEFILWSPWPITWAYVLLGAVFLCALRCFSWKAHTAKRSLVLLVVWLMWQFVSSIWTVDVELTAPTLAHFSACVLCYVLGGFCLSRFHTLSSFFFGLLVSYVLVLAVGFHQQFGGLEETRRHFYLYVLPEMKDVPPELLKKISSPRIFATLFYPNTFAGLLLLLLPVVLVLLAQARRLFTAAARGFLVSAVAAGSLGCLVWSGSKGGWLVMLFMALAAMARVRIDRRLKGGVILVVLLAGVAAFGLKYESFFRKGATSVVARFDYWAAALHTAIANPWVGTGPGTFQRPYQNLKKPESEMARLVHNDYLEQASDSGWPGFLAYSGFILTSLIFAYPPRTDATGSWKRTASSGRPKPVSDSDSWLGFALWLGVLGWSIQSLFDFGLYIPALAWPAFAFLGLMGAGRGWYHPTPENP